MSLYRQAGGRGARAIVPVAILCLLLGGIAGFLIRGDDEPSLGEALERLRGDVQPIRSALDLVPIEYRQAAGRGRGAARSELQGALSSVRRARATFAQVRGELHLLDPAGTRRIGTQLAELESLIRRRAGVSTVTRLSRRADSDLRALTGR